MACAISLKICALFGSEISQETALQASSVAVTETRQKSKTQDQGQGQDWLNKTRTGDAHHVDRKFGTALSAFANRYMSYMVNSRKTFIARHYSDLRNAHYWKRERRVFCHPKIKKNQTVLNGKKV